MQPVQLSLLPEQSPPPPDQLFGQLQDGEVLPLCRLRYGGSAARWGFAIYLASKDGYEDSVLPTGGFAGAPEEALDCACDLYLSGPDI